jgi:aconitate hydratase
MLAGKKLPPGVSLTISPGSRQVFETITRTGDLRNIISSGARILECACGPCIGMGQSPNSGAVSLRTFNRNFKGRSGTPDAGVYLCSPAVAAASALAGKITDPRKLGQFPKFKTPEIKVEFDKGITPPPRDGSKIELLRGPNIKPLPQAKPLPAALKAKVILKTGDNITTDHILPAGAKILPLRSNIPAISKFTFAALDETFSERALAAGSGVIVGGSNYGQGSSREHAAIAPMYLGIRAVIAKSFARIHRANLINFGILPLLFTDAKGYGLLSQDDQVELPDIKNRVSKGMPIELLIVNKNKKIALRHDLSPKEIAIITAGGKLNYCKKLIKKG